MTQSQRGWLKRRAPLWTPTDVADYWLVHVDTIYRRIRSGDMPAMQLPNGAYRIEEDDAITYGGRIAKGCTTAQKAAEGSSR